MSKWKYLKGSENDFEGAPEWARLAITGGEFINKWFLESFCNLKQRHVRSDSQDCTYTELDYLADHYIVIAQREPITDEDDLNDCIGQHHDHSKYHREIKPGVWVDIYDVLKAWNVTNPALQHLIKKAAQPGIRGHKTKQQDLQDIIDSAIRAKELESK